MLVEPVPGRHMRAEVEGDRVPSALVHALERRETRARHLWLTEDHERELLVWIHEEA
jgi:hypothetical protein